ncbi:uncharacterized protein LOC128389460 [Panonychus citri]|uniref:uncharacterized protein LOC128389460 n=1 Tax=Panonychus citri TaxID=50023 RepID=UPI0023083222|nr:uncharacterized protein LOC128389460 [Panonychus citri]
MNRFLAITFVIVVSSYYCDAFWGEFGDWAKGMTPCEICKNEAAAEVAALEGARDAFIPGIRSLPGLKRLCGKYPTPEGSCDSFVKVFEASFDHLIERQSRSQELCAYYGVCESNSTLEISLPSLPVAPVTPKQNPSKVYDDAVCKQCTDIIAGFAFMGVGNYAKDFAARTENNCLDWVKTTESPSVEDYRKCLELNSVYFDSITNNMIDKSTQNYLCWDLFDVCEPSKKPSELVLPDLTEIIKN